MHNFKQQLKLKHCEKEDKEDNKEEEKSKQFIEKINLNEK